MRMVPLDFRRDGTPRDAKLLADASDFYKDEFTVEPDFASFAKAWVALRDDGLILGLTGVISVVDIPLFHIKPPTMDKEGLRLAEAARDMAVARIHAHLEDTGLTGSTAVIGVDPKAERFWKKFLCKIGATPANRGEMKV